MLGFTVEQRSADFTCPLEIGQIYKVMQDWPAFGIETNDIITVLDCELNSPDGDSNANYRERRYYKVSYMHCGDIKYFFYQYGFNFFNQLHVLFELIPNEL